MNKKMIEPTDEMINDVELRHKLMYMDDIDIMRATLNHPDAAKLFADEDDRPWEPLTKGDPLNLGDEVRREMHGVTITAVVGYVDADGDPWTVEDNLIGFLGSGTWYVRRAVQELPTDYLSAIVTNDGYMGIEAQKDGRPWYTNEAVLGEDGMWHGVWRSDNLALPYMMPKRITADTWKVDEK